MIKSNTLPLITHPNGTLRLEYTEDIAILHIFRLSKMTVAVFRWGIKQVQNICDFLGTAGYEHVFIVAAKEDKKLNRLVKKLGFSYIKEHDLNGVVMNVYKRSV